MRKTKYWAAALLLILFGINHSTYAAIEYRYFYDELDRLTKAADSTGVVLEYSYDKVGNILEVTRTENSGLSILDVQPHAAQVGEQVTIEGIGFSAVASENTVTFDGITANVVTATINQLAVEVPVGVTAGVIVVTVGSNTATNSGSFQLQTLPIINSLSTAFVLSGQSIPALVVTGSNLIGGTFSFIPDSVPPGVVVSNATVAPDGLSATLTVNVSASAIGSYVLQASNPLGQSDSFSTEANTLVVLGSATDDSDGDGISNEDEIVLGTNPTSSDTDDDGLPDRFEIENGLDPNDPSDALLDSDGDGINNLAEYEQGTDPQNPDTTPPGIVQVLPADNTVDFATNANIVVRFNEPLQPESILLGSVRLFHDDLLVAGKALLSNDQLSLTFEPIESLSAFSNYTIQVQAVRDVAGNAMVGVFQSHFTTGEFIDDVSPSIIGTNIASGATDVPINVPFTVLFDEPMEPATLNDSTFSIKDNFVAENVKGMVQVDPDGMTVSFVPEQPFAVGRSFSVTLNTAITDLSGNPLSSIYDYSFETEFDEDFTPPSVVAISPPLDALDIPGNSNIMIEFSEPLDLINIRGAITAQANDINIPGSIALSNGNSRVTFTPAEDLPLNTIITLSASAEITDLAGNALGTTLTGQFTTGIRLNLQQPRVTGMTPFDGERDVPTNTLLQIKVDERINPLTVTASSFQLFIREYFFGIDWFVTGTRSVSDDGKTLTFTPDAPLDADREYDLHVSSDVRDLANNPLVELNARFTTRTGASTGPFEVTGINIPDGATEVPVNTPITVQFSDAVSETNLPSDAVVLAVSDTPVAGTHSLSSDRRQLTFIPSSNLTPSTAYTVAVSGAVSVSGSSVAAFNSGFTTSDNATADTSKPTLLSVNPADNVTGVPSSAAAVVQFSERINPLTVTDDTFYIEQFTSSDNYARIAGSITVATDGQSATFTPDQQMTASTRYRIRVTSGVQDLVGNRYASTSIPSTFTVDSGGVIDIMPPTVVMVTPTDGSTEVHRDTRVTLTFSESLDPNTINANTFALLVNGRAMSSVNITRSSDNRAVTLSSRLPWGIDIAVVVTSGARDLAGNAIADFRSMFTTGTHFDVSRPVVTSQRPDNGARNIPVDQRVVLFVDESLNAATIPNALHVSQNSVLVSGTSAVTPDGRAIEFVPDAAWEHDALIQVFLDDTAQDLSGNSLRDYQGSFRTVVDPGLTGPSLVRTNLTTTANILPTNPIPELEFSEPLDAATINDTTIVLRENTGGSPIITSTLSLVDGRIVRVEPNTVLKADTRYYVQIFNGIKDLDGQRQRSDRPPETLVASIHFLTGVVEDNTPPVVIAVLPSDGLTEVALNSHIRVRFDERINPLTVSTDTIHVTDGVEAIIPHSISFTDSNRDVLITPFSPLTANTVYSIIIDGVEDNAGNAVTMQTSQFTTGNEIDTFPPSIIITTPFRNATDVPINSPVIIEFDEPIDPVSVNSNTFYVRDHTIGRLVGTSSVSTDGQMISFVPDAPFAVERGHTIIINSPLSDLTGNRFSSAFYTFTTGFDEDTVAPQVLQTAPQDGLTDVPTNVYVMVRFDEPIQSVDDDLVTLSAGSVEIPVARFWSDGNRLLILVRRTPLAANTAYTLTVDAALKDLAGNAIGTAVTSQFTTGAGADIQRPRVTGMTPFDGETGVPTDTVLQVSVDERINSMTVTSKSFALYNRTSSFGRVSGAHNVSADGKTLTFVPDQPLESNSSFILFPISDARDLADNQLISDSVIFTTGP